MVLNPKPHETPYLLRFSFIVEQLVKSISLSGKKTFNALF
jgi:hypothetical protein